MTGQATTAVSKLEVAELETERLPLSELTPHLANPKIHFTRENAENLFQIYYWLAEYGDEYTELAETVRNAYYFVQSLLDVEAGIKQGYLKSERQKKRPKVV